MTYGAWVTSILDAVFRHTLRLKLTSLIEDMICNFGFGFMVKANVNISLKLYCDLWCMDNFNFIHSFQADIKSKNHFIELFDFRLKVEANIKSKTAPL